MKDTALGVATAAPPNSDEQMGADMEKTSSGRPYAGDGYVPDDFREQDFMTRNGLNWRSFTRRESLPHSPVFIRGLALGRNRPIHEPC